MAFLASIALVGCVATSGGSTVSLTKQDLVHHHYNLESVNGELVTDLLGVNLNEQKRPDIEFQEGFRLAGIAGCNRFFGQGELSNGVLKMLPGGSTMMACQPELSKIEQTVLNVLNEGAQVTAFENKLTLKAQSGELVYVLADYMH
ncbi:META domain-containing protein [Echinimonas agarilytica]|nr:META domain-containing protein [Echinimonas agarilytica]